MENYNRQNFPRDPIVSCFVPSCTNKVMTTPEKKFFRVPSQNQAQWCVAVNRRVAKGGLYICEDHLNLEEDLANYENWRTKNVTARLKPQVPQRLYFSNINPQSDQPDFVRPSASVQCSKAVQVSPCVKSTSTLTSPFLGSRVKKTEKPCVHEEIISSEDTASVTGSTTEFICTEDDSSNETVQELTGRKFLMKLVENKPLEYIGLPKQLLWAVNYLHTKCKIPSLHIIITLYKIKNNDTLARISDLFEISLVSVWRIFYKVIKILSSFFKQFIYWPADIDIKRNLPTSFRINEKFVNTQAIIDCFEIEIEKPKDPIEQSLTWSQYKHCNTIKYLVSTTPDGFINFVSTGYGGRISDISLVEHSGFLEIIPENIYILADRGFKHLESILSGKSCKVLRPPTVLKDSKMTKSEAIESKVIASLRVHVERVIRRLRLFRMLKPHSVVNNKLVSSLDDAVLIACGLINFQSPIVKNY